jgi:hypothetical protein
MVTKKFKPVSIDEKPKIKAPKIAGSKFVPVLKL